MSMGQVQFWVCTSNWCFKMHSSSPPKTKSELATLMSNAASRITFARSLDWNGESSSFNVHVEDDFLVLRESFRAGDSNDPWLQFEAKAPNDPPKSTSTPFIEVCVKFPWSFSGKGKTELVLAKVNEMNLENPGCSTCLDHQSGQIAIRSRIGFSGYFSDSDEPKSHGPQIRDEVTMNMYAEVIGTALGWCKRIEDFHALI